MLTIGNMLLMAEIELGIKEMYKGSDFFFILQLVA